jgi:SAM-dependent methyltransferase
VPEEEIAMDVIPNPENEQRARWNGPAGRAWIDTQQVMDEILKPYEDLLAGTVEAGAHSSVIDIGCGTGATTLAVARRLGQDGRVAGIDISEQMIEAARERAEQEGSRATFLCADAQHHVFEAGSVDTIISRFAVMFFSDAVAAFANLRRATAVGGRLHALAWRGPADNPFMTTAERAAAPLLPNLPPRRPDGPGQFAFADKTFVQGILRDSGWTEIEIDSYDADCTLPEKVLVPFLTRFGPVGMALQEADETTRTKVTTAVRAAFEPFVRGSEVRFTGGCWYIHATA